MLKITTKVLFFSLVTLTVIGCGVDQERFGEEAKQIRGLVPGLSGQAKCDPQKFAMTFAPDRAPMTNRAQYAIVEMVANSAKIEGDQAVLEVSLFNPQTGEKIADQQWTAVKLNGSWKLQEAPLP